MIAQAVCYGSGSKKQLLEEHFNLIQFSFRQCMCVVGIQSLNSLSYLHVGVVVIKQQGLGRSHVLRREPSAVALVLRRGQRRVVGGEDRVPVCVAVLGRVKAGRRYHGWLFTKGL